MTTRFEQRNPIGAIPEGQPARIKPVEIDEAATAHHEAAHATFLLILDCWERPGNTSIWEGNDGWGGFVEAISKDLPPIDATMPIRWQAAARQVWANLLVGFAGAAAESRYRGDPLDGMSIRHHWSAEKDAKIVAEFVRHFWPTQHQDTIQTAAAEVAGQMVQFPNIWAAIEDVADFLLQHGRYRANVFEVSVIVRARIPQNIPAPLEDMAVALIRRQS